MNGAARDLAGLDMNGDMRESKAPNLASATHLSLNREPGFNALFYADEGILFEDSQIQVGVRSEYRSHMGVVKIYYTNKASFSIGTVSAPNPKIDTKSLPDSTMEAGSQTQQTVFCNAHAPFPEAPTMRVSYLAGALQAYTLKLPIMPHKYMDPSELSPEDFFKRIPHQGDGQHEDDACHGDDGLSQRIRICSQIQYTTLHSASHLRRVS